MINERIKNERINALVNDLSRDPDIVSVVKDIEGSIKTTLDHYGRYMSFLSGFTSQPGYVFIMAMALKQAGANADGVNSAVSMLQPYIT
jgi:hypothetical protein